MQRICRLRVLVVDADDTNPRVLRKQFQKAMFGAARRAPRRPDIHDRDVALEARGIDRRNIRAFERRKRELRRFLADKRRRHHGRIAAVDAEEEHTRKREKDAERDEDGRKIMEPVATGITLQQTGAEITLFDHQLKISGNPDLLWMHEGEMHVIEIKSITKNNFNELTSPQVNHLFQSSCYHRLLSAQGIVTAPNVITFYTRKEWEWKTPYKEFHSSANELSGIISHAFDQVAVLRESENQNDLPAKLPVCNTAHSPTAKNCPVCTNCFARN